MPKFSALCCCLALLLVATSVPNCFAHTSELVSTKNETPVYRVSGPTFVPTKITLSPDTLLVTIDELKDGNTIYLKTRTIFPARGPLIVRKQDTITFKNLTQDLADKLPSTLKTQPQGPGNQIRVPASIQTGGPLIARAWNEINPVILLNESWPEADRLPEPYFTRAQLWARVKNYPAALKDYLLAFKYASSETGNLNRYSNYGEDIVSAINNFTTVPAAPIGANPSMALSSLQHLATGISYYQKRNYQAAVRSLDNSIAINMHNAVAWYYLALAYKKLDNLPQANFSATKGASIERRTLNYKSMSRSINRTLAKVQGKDRSWLEHHRLGNP